MPDEYLPPNKILFLQNLPESVTKEQLMALFSQLGSFFHLRYFSQLRFMQVSKPLRSSSDSHEERHRLRGVSRRSQCRCGQRCTAQLQTRWRKQDKGNPTLNNDRLSDNLSVLDHFRKKITFFCYIQHVSFVGHFHARRHHFQ